MLKYLPFTTVAEIQQYVILFKFALTFRNLKEFEEFEREKIEREKIVVKFECKGIMIDDKDKEKDDTDKKSGIAS